jgi:hypothetical protein
MKKEYMKPEQRVVVLQHEAMLLQASKLYNNADLEEIITGGSEPGRAPLFDGPEWDALLGE